MATIKSVVQFIVDPTRTSRIAWKQMKRMVDGKEILLPSLLRMKSRGTMWLEYDA